MKLLRYLVLADTAFLMILGFGMVLHLQPFPVVYPEARQYATIATLRVLGTAVGGLAVVVLATSTLFLLGNYREFAVWLSVANVLLAAMAGIQQQAIWGSTIGWFLFLIPLVLGAALAWVGLRPLKPEEVAAELSTLGIPEEIRQALLRQIGEAAAQEERNRLARDLHDSIKQQLFSINVGTAAAQERWERDPEGARSMLADVRRSAKEAMVEMQALLHQLRPEALTSTGLVEALREQCQALGYRTSAEVTLELGEALPDDRLLPGTEETLFRIAQEALGNVARHARARKVRVWLGREGESVRLRIEDDGQGFDPEAKVSGMGLRNLGERAVSLRGTLETDSAPGMGTTVSVTIPLSPSALEPFPVTRWRGEEIGMLFMLIFAVLSWPLFRPLRINEDFVLAFGCVNFTWAGLWTAGAIRRRTQSYLAASPSLSRTLADRVMYLNHRNRARAFFLAAVWSPWAWRLGEIWSGWTILCIGVALFCVGKAVAELVHLHRVSEVRSRWWSLRLLPSRIPSLFSFIPGRVLLLFSLGYLIFLIPIIVLFWIIFGLTDARQELWHLLSYLWPRPLGTVEILCLVLGAALLLYFRSRRPITKEAAI